MFCFGMNQDHVKGAKIKFAKQKRTSTNKLAANKLYI